MMERTGVDHLLDGWELQVTGLVGRPARLSWDALRALPASEVVVGARAASRWGTLSSPWRGVALDVVAGFTGVRPEATQLICRSEHGFPCVAALDDVLGTDRSGRPRALLAYEYDGRPLEPEHGFPLRLVVPALYFWKSAPWLYGLELADDRRAAGHVLPESG